jgi:hypothetical protein
MVTSIYGWLAILLVILFSVEYCNSQHQELQLSLQPYHQLPNLHSGVVRDFETLQGGQEIHHPFNDGGSVNSDRTGSRSKTNALETTENHADRMLQTELGFCYDALYLADQNQDNKVDADEFVAFAQIMGPPGFLPNSNTYRQLPLILQSNFIILACLCLQIPNFGGGTGIDRQCCAIDPHIDISGTQPGQIPTSKQSQYLYQVCFLTETSIDRLLLSATPTLKPSEPPTIVAITDKPTDKPSEKPTEQPSDKISLDPTTKPTINPTTEPTTKPTAEPTAKPTSQPTAEPTSEPSAKPSRSPTTEPSRRPTENPTDETTLEPSAKPSAKPSATPTEKPTDPSLSPSLKPTESQTLTPTMEPIGTTPRPSIKPTIEDDNVSSFPVESPSAGPTDNPEPVTEVAIVDYGIAITNGMVEEISSSSFIPDLIESMGIVAEEVANSMNLGERENSSRGLQKEQQNVGVMRRSLRLNQRKLTTIINVDLPTNIERLQAAECPPFVPLNDDCRTVTASVKLNIDVVGDATTTGRQDNMQALTDPTIVSDLFQENLNAAIENGALQAALIEVNPNTVVTITTGFITESPTVSPTVIVTPAPTSEPVIISGGGIAGIVLAGVGGLIIGFLIIAALRRRGIESSGGNSAAEFQQDVEETGRKEGEMHGVVITDLGQGNTGDDNFGKPPSSTLVDPDQSPIGAGTGVAVLAATAAVGTAAALAATSSSERDDSETKLSASVGSPGKKKKIPLYEVPGAKLMIADDASSAGESGWSSNQDGSSANTSIDASLDSIPQSNFSGIVLGGDVEGEMGNETVDEPSSSLASPTRSQSSEQVLTIPISLSRSRSTSRSPQSQGPSQDNSYSGTTGTEGSIQSTYSELDEAINKGDWAAVGVTAALLASQAYVDESTQGSSKQSTSRLRRPNAALNPERAAELDRLVEIGDWEGVVAAAAKFDAQEALRGDAHSSNNSESGSAVTGGSNTDSAMSGSVGGSSGGTAPSNMSGSQTIDTTTSPSTYTATGLTATSDTASTRSKARKLNEIRDEVEALVTAVVPEEADNVDEMMTQFRGREEELVETLRSMQERQVAQKARKESQKQAKRQAKEYVQDKKKQETFEAVDNTGNTADDIWMREIEDFDASAGDKTNDEAKGMTDQLKEAINNENWENVAEAAAGLSGHKFLKGQSSPKDNESVDSVDINALVDKGDWDGVVAAASRYAEGSTNASSSNDYTQEDTEELADDSTIEQRRKRREERLKEEEEALAQAEIWDAIADQTKRDDQEEKGNSGNTGAAKMAADWAIDQSLAALKKAEEERDDDSEDSGQDKRGDNESL